MTRDPTSKRFDNLLRMMVTQPEPSGKPAIKYQTSSPAAGAGYGDNSNSAGKSASASSKPMIRNVP